MEIHALQVSVFTSSLHQLLSGVIFSLLVGLLRKGSIQVALGREEWSGKEDKGGQSQSGAISSDWWLAGGRATELEGKEAGVSCVIETPLHPHPHTGDASETDSGRGSLVTKTGGLLGHSGGHEAGPRSLLFQRKEEGKHWGIRFPSDWVGGGTGRIIAIRPHPAQE